jgi:hypothetical protein
MTGGKSPSADLNTAEIYDPVTAQFQQTSSMHEKRSLHTATLLNDGKVLVAAGRQAGGETLTAELFDPISGSFSYTGSLSLQRKRHRATLLLDGTVLVSGGGILPNAQGRGDRTTDTAELFTPATGAWTNVQKMHTPRGEHESMLLPDGTALVTGGTFVPGSAAEIYQPATQSFSLASQMVQTRLRHTAIVLSHPAWASLVGKVLVIGGVIPGGSAFGGLEQAVESTELYDPATGQFSQFASMAVARQNHTATLLLDGRILVTGGVGRPFISGTAELVSP